MFWTALRKELLEQWRSYRLLIVLAVLLGFGLTSPLLAKLTPELLKQLPEGGEAIAQLIPEPTALDAVAQYVKNLTQFGVILALLMTMGAVAQEKDKGTAAMMLVKPMPRGVFLAAKFTALCLTFALGLALAGLAGYYYTLLLFEALDAPRFLALNGLLLVFVAVHVALTLFFSTLARSPVAAGGMAFGGVILLALVGVSPSASQYLPGQLVAWGAGLMAGNLDPSWPALWTSLAFIAAALVGARALFEKQEL